MIFAEGGTTNNSGLSEFKRGAFYGLRPIQPMYMNYKWSTVSPSFETIAFVPLVAFQCSWFCTICEFTIMPPFFPNDYMYETHADKGEE
jgi:hypothetical protein